MTSSKKPNIPETVNDPPEPVGKAGSPLGIQGMKRCQPFALPAGKTFHWRIMDRIREIIERDQQDLTSQERTATEDPGMLCDRISFRRFVGLKMEQNVPDESLRDKNACKSHKVMLCALKNDADLC